MKLADLLAVLSLSAGYNTALVCLGAAILGAAAGGVGAFILLRKRSLVSDAVSHATLPGLVAGFLLMTWLTGDGRSLPVMMLGAALSAGFGILCVEWIIRRTRLPEDAAIGVVLSVFFGVGVVLMSLAQSLQAGNQAGLASYLVGSTAGMLRSEAQLIAIAAAVAAVLVILLRRRFLMVCFDPEYAAVRGIDVRRTDLLLLGLLLMVTVIGLKVAGLVLIVALTIIPPVTARFWSNRPEPMVLISAAIGALSGYLGAAVSALDKGLPTGSLVVLTAFVVFLFSLLFSPLRGVLAVGLGQLRFRLKVHKRQGLLALSRKEPIYDRLTLRVLRRSGYIRADAVATPAGLEAARAARHEEALWHLYRRRYPEAAANIEYQGLVPLTELLAPELVTQLEAELAGGPA